jgi:conjugal transfer ATP-binding protein TraC
MFTFLKRKKTSKEKDLLDVIPIVDFENDKTVFKDGRVGVGFRIIGAELDTWQESDYEGFNNTFCQQVSGLPVNTVVQITDFLFDREYNPETIANSYFELKTQRYFMYRLMLGHEAYLFISVAPVNGKARKVNPTSTLLFSAGTSLLGNPFEHIEETLELAEKSARQFISGVNGTNGVTFERLTKANLQLLYSKYFNLSFERDYEPGVFHEISVSEGDILIGDQKLNVITLDEQGTFIEDTTKNYLGVTSPSAFPIGCYLQFPHITTTSFWVKDTETELKALDSKKSLNQKMEWLASQDNEVAAREIVEFTNLVRTDGNRIVGLNINVMVFERDSDIRKDHLNKAIAALKSIGGGRVNVEATDTFALYLANVPGNAFNNYRWILTSDVIAAKYAQFMTNQRSEQRGDLLCDRFRSPLLVNFFNDQMPNQNAVVVGGSGSGKSFTNSYLLTQRHERKCRQIIIDVGGSYKNTVTILNGEDFKNTYFEYSIDQPMKFNPFLTIRDADGKYHLHQDKSIFLESLLFTLWKGKGAAEAKQVEISVMKTLVARYYDWLNERARNAKMKSFYEFLEYVSDKGLADPKIGKALKFFDVAEFMAVLRPFYDGVYKDLLNSDSETEISDYHLICFDLVKIAGDKMIYSIVTLLITQMALESIAKFPNDEKFIYMDEAWTMLSGTLSEFIENMYRTVRKANGSVWIITQSASDIANSAIGAAVLQNAATKIVLRHDNLKDIETTCACLGFTSHDKELLQSLRKEANFREILVKMADKTKVFLVEVSPAHGIALSSKPSERNELVRLMKKFPSTQDAIEEYIQSKQLKTPA